MAQSSFVLDASVLVALVRRTEAHHEETRQALQLLVRQAVKLYLPAIALAEVAAAIARGINSAERATRAVADLLDMPGLQILAADEPLSRVAAEIAARQHVKGCDAVYLAMTHVLAATLITLDRQQRERAPAGMRVLTPGEILTNMT